MNGTLVSLTIGMRALPASDFSSQPSSAISSSDSVSKATETSDSGVSSFLERRVRLAGVAVALRGEARFLGVEVEAPELSLCPNVSSSNA